MGFRDTNAVISRCIFRLPDNISNQILAAKYFIHHHAEMSNLDIVNAYENCTICPKELPQQGESRINHAEPFVMAR